MKDYNISENTGMQDKDRNKAEDGAERIRLKEPWDGIDELHGGRGIREPRGGIEELPGSRNIRESWDSIEELPGCRGIRDLRGSIDELRGGRGTGRRKKGYAARTVPVLLFLSFIALWIMLRSNDTVFAGHWHGVDEKEAGADGEGEAGMLRIDSLETDGTVYAAGYASTVRVRVMASVEETGYETGEASRNGLGRNESAVITGYAMKGPFFGREAKAQFEEGDFSEGNTFEITGNGIYFFAVRDSLGRIAEAFSSVDIIDRNAPVITGIESEPIRSRGGYGKKSMIRVYAYDTQSRLASDAFSFDDGLTYVKDYFYETDRNGLYYIRVRDALGNVSRLGYEVSNIDDEPPVITIEGNRSEMSYEDVYLTVKVSDDKSGIDSIRYKAEADEESIYLGYYELEKEESEGVRISKNGEYTFYCMDGAGNESSFEVKVTAIDKSLGKTLSNRNSSSSKKSGTTGKSSGEKKTVVINGSGGGISSKSAAGELVMRQGADYRDEEDDGYYISPYPAADIDKKTEQNGRFVIENRTDDEEDGHEEAEEDFDEFEEGFEDGMRMAFEDGGENTAVDFHALESEYIEGVYEERLAASQEVSEDTALLERSAENERERRDKTGPGSGRILAAGAAIVVLLLAVLAFGLIRFGIIELPGKKDEEPVAEDEE